MSDRASSIILSRREKPFVGWVAIDEFEDLFSRLSGAEIVIPHARKPYGGLLGRAKRRILGEFEAFKEPLPSGDLLLVMARSPGDLGLVNSIGSARNQFRYVAGYIIDSYFVEALGPATKRYDHIFSTTEAGAECVRKRFGISSSVLRQGFDCLRWSCASHNRSIDLIGFGRQPPSYHRAFQAEFHREKSKLLYLHSPIGTAWGPDVWIERPMLLKLLQRSKISLAFHLGIEAQHDRPRNPGFVTSRWFESLASGCIVAGKRPPGIMAQEMFDWDNSTIELPDDPIAAVEIISNIVGDCNFQEKARERNVAEMRRRHDWRYRIREIYRQFELDLPSLLVSELAELNAV
ncbi:MAG: glycosyltransferase [Methylovirgula sp.]